MKIAYEVKMNAELAEDTGVKVIQAIEDFINTISPLMPMPAISFRSEQSAEVCCERADI